jgi:voltage-gated potassium channel
VPEHSEELDSESISTGFAITLRQRVHDILEHSSEQDPVSLVVNGGLITLILLNVIAFAAETVPSVDARYGRGLDLFNVFSVAVFTVEYALRLWSCVEIPILKLLFYLSFIIPMDLRVLRVLRLFRFLKLARYSPALHSLGRVIANERRALIGALLLMMSLLLFASTGIYFLERDLQPEAFGSIPAAAWWALATLTTVGFGDVVPVTVLGKLFGGLIMIFGLGMFALPIAIVATGFSQEANRREFVVTWGMVARVPIFARLDAATLTEIMVLLYSRSYEAGDRIMRVGEEADAMFFITSGEVIVDGDAGPITLSDGDFFGEMGLIERRLRAHNVTARTRCRVLVLEKTDFERLCHSRPEIMVQVAEVAKARSRAVEAAVRAGEES